ncbi:MAG: hypothetical protein RL385_2443, partial [Pseudomonadota bacterium]
IQLKRGAGNTPGTATGPVNVKGIDCVAMAKSGNPTVPVMAPSTPTATDAGAPVASPLGDAGTGSGAPQPMASDAGSIAVAGMDAGVLALPVADAGTLPRPAADSGALPTVVSAADAGLIPSVTPAATADDGDSGCNASARRPAARAAWTALLCSLLVAAFVRRRRRAS